jgi:hypothetical protein
MQDSLYCDRSLNVLLELNYDRLLCGAAMAVALMCGAALPALIF